MISINDYRIGQTEALVLPDYGFIKPENSALRLQVNPVGIRNVRRLSREEQVVAGLVSRFGGVSTTRLLAAHLSLREDGISAEQLRQTLERLTGDGLLQVHALHTPLKRVLLFTLAPQMRDCAALMSPEDDFRPYILDVQGKGKTAMQLRQCLQAQCWVLQMLAGGVVPQNAYVAQCVVRDADRGAIVRTHGRIAMETGSDYLYEACVEGKGWEKALADKLERYQRCFGEDEALPVLHLSAASEAHAEAVRSVVQASGITLPVVCFPEYRLSSGLIGIACPPVKPAA